MKRLLAVMGICGCTIMPMQQLRAQDPISLIIKEGIKKAIKAVDLKIQQLQNKTIWLQNAQKTLENKMSRLKLNEIRDWAQKQKQLYEDYFQELRQVKAVIANYRCKFWSK